MPSVGWEFPWSLSSGLAGARRSALEGVQSTAMRNARAGEGGAWVRRAGLSEQGCLRSSARDRASVGGESQIVRRSDEPSPKSDGEPRTANAATGNQLSLAMTRMSHPARPLRSVRARCNAMAAHAPSLEERILPASPRAPSWRAALESLPRICSPRYTSPLSTLSRISLALRIARGGMPASRAITSPAESLLSPRRIVCT